MSHAWEYHDEYVRLIRLLDSARYFKYQNYSVPRYDPLHARTKTQLVKELYDQIKPTHIVIILAGMYVNYREWILKEIEIALELGKPIIGIKPWGRQRVPKIVQNVADEVVGWNTESIVNAIRRNSL